jgi:hypothetical protein
VLGKLRGQRVFVLFQRDAFSFFSQLRSRNAGLPLLFTAFSLADAVLTLDEDAYHAALKYKNVPEKFHIVQPDLSLLRREELFAEELAGQMMAGQMEWSFSAVLADGLTQKEKRGTVALDYPAVFVIRPLQCNGEFVAREQAALIELPKVRGNELDSAGVIVIPKESPKNIEALFRA